MSPAELQAKLADALGPNSILHRRLNQALLQRDRQSINGAMRSLTLYPLETRRAVERVLMAWLFDPEDVGALLSQPVISQR